MPDELSVAVAQEVVKQVPLKEIYDDAFSPAAKQVGGALEAIAKTCRLALAPFELAALGHDRFQQFIRRSKDRVPEDRLVLPPTQILGPVLEGIRYEPEGSISEEAFSRLLSAAFDRERGAHAHPAFAHLIRTLAADELVLLRLLSNRCYVIVTARRIMGQGVEHLSKHQVWLFPELAQPEQIRVFVTHLEALGLINDLTTRIRRQYPENEQHVVEYAWHIELSDFGELFVAAALIDPATND